MIGVILAAGNGKRLKESSKEDYCKPLIKIKEKMLIEYSLDNLIESGITDAYIVVGKEGDLIKKVLGERYGILKLFYVVQQEQKGLIDAFKQAVRTAGCKETIILQLSDEIFIRLDTEKIKKSCRDSSYDFYCGVTMENDPQKIKMNYSVETDEEYLIKKCVEKPMEVINNIKGTGFCIFGSKALQILDAAKDSECYDLCDYINLLIEKNKKGLALNIAEREFNINTFSDLFEAQCFLEKD